MKKNFLIGFILIIGVLAVSGCTNEEYEVSDSKFEVTSGWTYVNETSMNDSVAFKNGLLTMRVTQYENEADYETNYKDSVTSSTYYKVETENKTIKGVQIRFNNISDTRNTDNFQDYFFQKNGKYYSITILDYSSSHPFQDKINSVVEAIISTMN